MSTVWYDTFGLHGYTERFFPELNHCILYLGLPKSNLFCSLSSNARFKRMRSICEKVLEAEPVEKMRRWQVASLYISMGLFQDNLSMARMRTDLGSALVCTKVRSCAQKCARCAPSRALLISFDLHS